MAHTKSISGYVPDRSLREAGAGPLYDWLDSSIESIRLVRILPSSKAQPMECEMKTATTTDSYVCVSYCWGEPSKQLIRLNGTSFTVRENLYNLLKESKRRYMSEWLWINALCIDQSNVAERNHQVKQMAAIYRSARQVIVWLGNDIAHLHARGDATSEFDVFLKTMGSEQVPSTAPLTAGDLQSRWPHGKLFHNDGRLFIDNFHLFYLCKNPYWTRIWILQEFLLARTLTVWWGRHEFPAEVLLSAVSRNYTHCKEVLDKCKQDVANEMRFRDLLYLPPATDRYIVEESLKVLEQVHRLTKFRRVLQSERGLPSLCETIQSLKPSQCTDSRDRVYALLSLASDVAEFDVNYEEDLLHLYLRLLRHSKSMNEVQSHGKTRSLARCLGVDAQELCSRVFKRDFRPHWAGIFQSYIPGQGFECEVWALHSRRSYTTSGLVARAIHALSEKFAGNSVVCNICLEVAKSVNEKDRQIVECGAPEVWLRLNGASYSQKGRPTIHALQHDRGTFFEASLLPRRIRLTFRSYPDPAMAHWLLVVKRDDMRLAVVLPDCRYRNCALSGRSWQGSGNRDLRLVSTWAVTPTPSDSPPELDRESVAQAMEKVH